MSNKDTGGPAFPSHGSMGEVVQEGMHLRDYFAAKAMQASRARDSIYQSWEDLAKDSYEIADAMLQERKK